MNVVKWNYLTTIPNMISTLFSKLSVCLLLLRLFTVVSWRWTIYLIIILTAITNIALVTIVFVNCKPQAKFWNQNLSGTCWNRQIVYGIGRIQGGESAQDISISILRLTSQLGVSVTADFILSILPVYCLWKIQLTLRIKVAVCGLMSLGVL